MEIDVPLFAVQRLADGTWLVRCPLGDPLWPPVDVVAVVGGQASAAPRPARVLAARLPGAPYGYTPRQYPNVSAEGQRHGFEVVEVAAVP